MCFLPLPPLSQEGDDYEVIPNSKFYVSRTANKDNSSAYYISGKKATFKEVGALLRSHGIDLDHNRFLILQVIVIYIIIFLKISFSFTYNSAFFLKILRSPSHPIKSVPAFHSIYISQSSWCQIFHSYLKPSLSLRITCCTGTQKGGHALSSP